MSDIKPALTAEGWANALRCMDQDGSSLILSDFRSFEVHSDAGSWGKEGECPLCHITVKLAEHAWWRPECACGIWWREDGTAADATPIDPHARAALCLHGQPFGFTWEDVRLLREHFNWDVGCSVSEAEARKGTSLADRIAALLPPEEK